MWVSTLRQAFPLQPGVVGWFRSGHYLYVVPSDFDLHMLPRTELQLWICPSVSPALSEGLRGALNSEVQLRRLLLLEQCRSGSGDPQADLWSVRGARMWRLVCC